MDEQISEAVKTAKTILSTEEQWRMAAAFIFGSFTSAIWVLRQNKRKPMLKEVVSTSLMSGFIAIAVCNLLSARSELSLAENIAISILTGFSGDMIVRIVVERFLRYIDRKFGPPKTKDDEPDAE